MANNTSYGSIPEDPNASPRSGNEGASSNRKNFIAVAVILVGALGIFLSGRSSDDLLMTAPTVSVTDVQARGFRYWRNTPAAEHWPGRLVKHGGVIQPFVPAPPDAFPVYQDLPTDTSDAVTKGWVKINEPCNPLLGEEWLYSGERALKFSFSVYFTPEVGDVAGLLSAIEVQYYGYVEENLIGTYFSEEKTSKDGPYRSLPIALRNGEEEDLCDTEKPAAPGNSPYLTISPGMANKVIPANENSPELQSGWKEGSCITAMGYHWATDVETGADLTYKAENLVPVIPMYSSTDGTINAIFFVGTDKKQQFWPADCPPFGPPCATESFKDANMWDVTPGQAEANAKPFFFCNNFCGECQLTGTADGWFGTTHVYFKTPWLEKCAGGRVVENENPNNPRSYCRSGEYPTMDA